jgi:hypothetical protein
LAAFLADFFAAFFGGGISVVLLSFDKEFDAPERGVVE